ncbi:MAG: PQQ-dependent sugar dehydrogenase, partial [Candidatus Binatia bacterium]
MKLSASSGLVCVALSAAVVPGAGAQTVSDPALQVESVVNGLAAPTTMDFLGPDDFLVLQKNDGRVRRVLGGTLLAAPVLDVTVTNNSERGLLGIAIDREASPPIVFLYYTEGIGPGDGSSPLGNRIYRYRWNSSTGLLENGDLVADLPVTPGPNHDGGALLLGPPGDPDGRTLYAVIGDLNRDGQLENFPAGSPPDDTAVILALRADGSADPDNPFFPYCSQSTGQTCTSSGECPAGQTCRTEVRRYFAYGVRNSFGLGMDPVTGALWDTENGPSSYDEVNLVAPGFNSGWERIMGPDARDPQGSADLFHMPGGASEYSDPELSWLDPVAPTAILFP